ncbi:MAG: BolA family transcriptional regulator [Gammaproteobacteria bacterium]|nr:BolA family transcriptional regulator [Gammaproteobacteria bacterium]MCF6231259.1 BolA family transcriptional regulator [Gammaproteobacteria bacterium]
MSNRIERITAALEAAYKPCVLEVIDDSHQHAGHASAGGKGHFTIKIIADAFREQSLIQRHRMIHTTLAELLESDIHAISIKARAPE